MKINTYGGIKKKQSRKWFKTKQIKIKRIKTKWSWIEIKNKIN